MEASQGKPSKSLSPLKFSRAEEEQESFHPFVLIVEKFREKGETGNGEKTLPLSLVLL